jgi:predicted secreted hydrolase
VRRVSPLVLALLILVFGVGYALLRLGRPIVPEPVRTSLSVSDVMGASPAEGFATALEPQAFVFPRDHGPHPSFRTEWWYITGNVEGPDGDPYGFQFTIFRSALDPDAPESASPWATNQVFMGHLALTDGRGRVFRAFERFARGAQGLAGAQADPFRVWLEDWVLEGPAEEGAVAPDRDSRSAPGQDGIPNFTEGPGLGIFPLRLSASEDDVALSLFLNPSKPLVLQGNQGLSQKGPQPGNASFYYSFTRLETTGILTLEGREIPVEGSAWLDREWSTSALSENQVGWDWFALQLSDGRELMYYQLRLADGSPDPLSKGILVDREGGSMLLTSGMVDLEVTETWESPEDGTSYPSGWRLAIPSQRTEFTVTPLIPGQELNLTFRYWEGAVEVRGVSDGTPVEGRGYVELTGYSEGQDSVGKRSLGRGRSRP